MIPTVGVDVLVSLADRLSAPLRDAEATIARASERMNRRLQLSMRLAGAGAVATGVALGAQRMVTSFTNSIREVERARGELATLGVRDLDMIVRRGREMQMEWAGVTADAFVTAAYDIRSGISSLTDQGVADMTAAATIVARATRSEVATMTNLFAGAYGVFRRQFEDMTDSEWGDMFGASLAAAVQQFRTDGAAMAQAIESAGAGATNLGMTMTEQMALLGMMQGQMQAGEAGTALRAFATSAARAHEAFAELSTESGNPIRVRILDESGQLRAMPDILADLQSRYGETLDAFEAAEIQQAFGTDEAMRLINALYGQEAAVRANAEALEDAAARGAEFTEEMAQAANQNWDAAMQLLAQRFNVLQQMIGERLVPVLQRLMPYVDAFIATAFDWIDANPELVTGIGAVVVGLGAIAAVLAPILLGGAALVSTWAMMSYGATRLGLAVFNVGRWVAGAGRWLLWLGRLVLPLVGRAILWIGRALMLNPIGAIIMGIAAAAYLIYEYWEPISAFFQDLWAKVVDAFNSAVDWITSAVDSVISFDWSSLLTLDGLRSAWSAVTGFLGRVLGSLWDNLSPLAWFGIVRSEDLARAWAAVTSFITVATSQIWNGIASIEWGNFLTLDGLRAAWAGVTGFLGGVLGTLWDTLSPLSWAGIVKSDDLAAAWAGVTGFITGTASQVWAGITGIDWGNLLTLEGLRTAWSGVTGFIGGVVGDLWDALSPLSWAGLVNSEDLSAAWNAVTGFVSGTASRVWDGITSIEWSGLVDSEAMSRAIDSLVGIVERGWETLEGIFDSIIAAAAAVGERVGEAITVALDGARAALAALSGDRGVERIFGQLDALAENGWSGDFVQGQALTEALEAGQITLEAYRRDLAAVVEEGGRFAEIAAQMIDASGQLDTFTMPEPPAPQLPPIEEVEAVSARLSAIQAAAAEALAAVQSAITQIVGIVQGIDLTAEGARIAASIAAGIRAQIGEVRAAAAAMSAAIRGALPGNANVNVALSGATAPVQARASGGWYKPGWLLTGEQGPELRYETQGGFIAHNRALRGMLDMASRTRDLVSGIGFEGLGTSPVPALATVAAAAGPTMQRGPITLSPQYNMPMSFERGVDMDEVRNTVRQELIAAEERAQADLRRLLHD